MFEAYFDESESTGNVPRVYTVAGYVSTKDKWDSFKTEWQDFLHRERLPPFSMKNFCNPHDLLYGKLTHNKRTAIIRILHRILKKYYMMSFSTSVSLAAFEELSPVQHHALGSPHSFVAINCLKIMKSQEQQLGLTGRIHYHFEAGSRYQGHLAHLFETAPEDHRSFYRIGDVSFAGKLVQPLQAADMLAYETRKEMGRRLETPVRRPMRKSLANLRDPKRDYWVFLQKDDLNEIFKGDEIARQMSDPYFIESACRASEAGVHKKL